MFESDREFKNYVVKYACIDMYFCDDNNPFVIKIYEKNSKVEWIYWKDFLKGM